MAQSWHFLGCSMSHQTNDELLKLLHAMLAEMAELRQKIGDLENRVARGVQPEVATHKFPANLLTDRNQFNRECARMLSLDTRHGGSSSVIYFELENLNSVNAGLPDWQQRELLQEMAGVLCRHVRSCDVAGYLGQQEFGVLLTRCDEAHAWKKGEQLAGLLQQKAAEMLPKNMPIHVLYGVYAFKLGGDIHVGLKAAAGSMLKK